MTPRKVYCCDCGKRILVSLEGYQEHKENGQVWVWHHDCRAPWLIPDDSGLDEL